MSGKVVLIDDDIALTDLLRDYLEAEGFQVSVAHDGLSGLESIATIVPDIAVLDIMMPKLNGIEVLKKIRTNSLLPVVILTARGDDKDCVIGLELGADDYVAKPCNPHELAARIKAILRRTSIRETPHKIPSKVSAGPLMLFTARRRIELNGVALQLTSTEFNLLELLMLNAGSIVTKSDLSIGGIGRPLTPFDRIIDVHISSIRKKIGRLHDGRSLIKTVIRKGYQLIVE